MYIYTEEDDMLMAAERAARQEKRVNVREIIEYIDKAFSDRGHGESFWLDEKGNRVSGTDTGYAYSWWDECMKPELKRVFNA